jgi:hypothetical protein
MHGDERAIGDACSRLADPASAGKSDSTTMHLQFANSVNRQLAFLLPDGLLESLSDATPDTTATEPIAASGSPRCHDEGIPVTGR